MKNKILLCATILTLSINSFAQKNLASTEISAYEPISNLRQTYQFYSQPENKVKIQLPNYETVNVWQNMSKLFPTAQILREGEVKFLNKRIDNSIGKIPFKRTATSDSESVDEFFNNSNMQGLVVIKNGELVYEKYKTMRSKDKHNWFSVGKIVSSTLISLLQEEGKINVKNSVSTYIPELKNSQWDIVTVEDTLNMATGLDSTEHDEKNARLNPNSGWYRWATSIGVFYNPDLPKENVYTVLKNMKKVREPQTVFEYNSINTFVLELIVENVTGHAYNEVFSDYIWSKSGMKNDAYIAVSKDSNPMGFAFISSTLTDLAHFGLLFTPSWNKISNEKIISNNIVKNIQTNGNVEMYKKGAVGKILSTAFYQDEKIYNKYQWDAIFKDGDFFKGGVGGQGLYISPDKDVVLAWFSNGTEHNEETMAREIAKALKN